MICIQLCFAIRLPETSMHFILPNHPGYRVSYRCIQPTETLRWANPDRIAPSSAYLCSHELMLWRAVWAALLKKFILKFCGVKPCSFVFLRYPPDFCCHPSTVMVIIVVKNDLCKLKKNLNQHVFQGTVHIPHFKLFSFALFSASSSSNSLIQICLIMEAVWFFLILPDYYSTNYLLIFSKLSLSSHNLCSIPRKNNCPSFTLYMALLTKLD